MSLQCCVSCRCNVTSAVAAASRLLPLQRRIHTALISPQHRISRCSSAALLAAATPYSPLLQHRVLYCCFANVSHETFVRTFARSLSATHSPSATRLHMLLRMRNNAYRNGPRLSHAQNTPFASSDVFCFSGFASESEDDARAKGVRSHAMSAGFRASYAKTSFSTTSSFLILPTSFCSASITCGRMSPPISTYMRESPTLHTPSLSQVRT